MIPICIFYFQYLWWQLCIHVSKCFDLGSFYFKIIMDSDILGPY